MSAVSAPDADLVDRAMARVTRQAFLPPDQVRYAADDRPLPVGHGSTNSQPSTVAAMLRLLEVRSGDRTLDVGAGSGWTTCLLADLTGPSGSVIGVEIDPAVARWGAGNVARWITGTVAPEGAAMAYRVATPGVLGAPWATPFDRILVSAMAMAIPTELVEQLTDDGVLVVPVAGRMLQVRQQGSGEPTVRTVGSYRFVPLR